MAGHGDHELGSMDITDNQRTWKGFIKLILYSTAATLAVVFILIFIFG